MQAGQHRKIIVAVAECVGVFSFDSVMLEYIGKTGRLGVAVRDEFAECAAAVDAVEGAVADFPKRRKLRFTFVPDHKFIAKEIRIFQIFRHLIITV